MNEKILHILLANIEGEGTTDSLTRSGVTYIEIGEVTDWALNSGLVVEENGKVQLSDAGKFKLRELRKSMRRLNKSEWIGSEDSARISKLPIDFIYLPSQNDTSF